MPNELEMYRRTFKWIEARNPDLKTTGGLFGRALAERERLALRRV